MSNKINKSLILNKIKSHFDYKSDAEFARFLGIKPQTLASWHSRNTFDIELLYSKCVHIRGDWLLSGEGEMIQSEEINVLQEPEMEYGLPKPKSIPLVYGKATGSFGGSSFSISSQDIKAYYVIPKFNHKTIDFMIEMEGASMYPKYNSGDVIACTIINDSGFIQWNKAHIIATKHQGLIVKRIKKGSDDNCLLMVSDNKSYDPFEIPKEEIEGIALVSGAIRLE